MKQSKPYLYLAITFLLAHLSFGQNGRPLDLLEEEKLFIEFEPQGGFFEEGQNIELLCSDPSA